VGPFNFAAGPCISSQAVMLTILILTSSLENFSSNNILHIPVSKSEAITIGPISTRSSADADNRLDAFSGQSRSTTWYHSTCYI